MRSPKATEKSQKVRKNNLFGLLSEKLFIFFPGEDKKKQKKFGHKTSLDEENIFSQGKVFSERLEMNNEAAEKALDKKRKGILLTKKRIPVPMFLKNSNNNNNLCDFAVPQVAAIRRLYGEKPEYPNQLFNREYNTKAIFFA